MRRAARRAGDAGRSPAAQVGQQCLALAIISPDVRRAHQREGGRGGERGERRGGASGSLLQRHGADWTRDGKSAPESRESRDKGAPVVARCVRATGTAAAFAAAEGGVRKTKKRGASQARTAAASRHRAGREGLHHGRHCLTLLHVLRRGE